jgi:hypothetical protein
MFGSLPRAPEYEGTNKRAAAYPGDRPSFPPSPRAWLVVLGAADGPIGCALIFFAAAFFIVRVLCGVSVFDARHFEFCDIRLRHSTRRARLEIDGHGGDYGFAADGQETPRPGMTIEGTTPSAAARAAAPCVRRTAPGSRRRRRPPAGMAWRSRRPAPAVAQSGNAPDRQ